MQNMTMHDIACVPSMRNDWAGDRGFVERSEREFREDPDGHGKRKTSQALIALTNLEHARGHDGHRRLGRLEKVALMHNPVDGGQI